MAQPMHGHGGTIGIGVQSAYATGVSRSNWMPYVSCGLQRKREHIRIPHLGKVGQSSMNQRGHYVGWDDVSGSLEVIASYDDSTALLLEAAMGAVADAGGGPYTHTYTLAKTLLALTIERIRGEHATLDEAEVFNGVVIPRFELEVQAGGPMMLRCPDLIGRTSAGTASAGTPTYSTSEEEILGAHAGEFAYNGNDDPIQRLKITVDRKVSRRRELGSRLSGEPYCDDFFDVLIEGTLLYDGTAAELYAAHLADTIGDATITFTGSGNNALAITAHDIHISDATLVTNRAGALEIPFTARAESDGTDEGLELVLTNDNATSRVN